MRILVVTNMFPPHHYGGYELSCEDAVRRFTTAGHEVSVLTSTITVEGAGAERHHDVRRELALYWRDHQLLSPPIVSRVVTEVRNRRALARALAGFRPDVVSVWNMGALSLGLLRTLHSSGLPVVFVIGDDWPNYAPDLDAWSRMFRGRRRAAAGRVLTRMTGLPTAVDDFSGMGPCLFNSRTMMEVVERHGLWSMPVRGIIYTGVEPAEFPVASDDAPVHARPWEWRLLYVGRIDERKGIDTVIRALPSLPEAHLRVVGRGDEGHMSELRRLAASLGVQARVTFTASERAGLPEVYSSADVLIFPSVYKEPFGIVPLEAMACDTPVIATGTGGSGEYLLDGWNCLRYNAGDVAELDAALRTLASDSGLRTALVKGGRKTARVLTTESWMSSLIAWHEGAVSGFRAGRPPDRRIELGPSPSE
jgi:glycogen(starch) synthase